MKKRLGTTGLMNSVMSIASILVLCCDWFVLHFTVLSVSCVGGTVLYKSVCIT